MNKKSLVLISLVVVGVLFPYNQAYGMGFWNSFGKALQIYAKENAKQNAYAQKKYDKEIQKQRKEWDRLMNNGKKKPSSSPISDSPLNKKYLQKIETYEELLKKVKTKQDLKEIIDHIKKYGQDKYGDRLSQKHKDFLKDLEHGYDSWKDEEKKENTLGASIRNISGMAILAFIARIGLKIVTRGAI